MRCCWSRRGKEDAGVVRLCQDNGVAILDAGDFYRDEQALHANIKAFFGTYRAAIKAAGIDYRDVRHIDLTETWTAEKVIERIQKLHRKQPLTCIADIRRRDSRLYDRCYHYFKSAVVAIEAAG